MYAPTAVLSHENSGISPTCDANAPVYLVPPCMADTEGAGIVIPVRCGKLLVITVGINHVVEQESLALSIWGSVDGHDWGTEPLIEFPRKNYCGIYSTFLDLAKYPQVRHLRAQWNMLRWGQGSREILFGFYVTVQEAGA
jgi:hypothetical protein